MINFLNLGPLLFGALVILLRNPIQAVLSLIIVFVLSAIKLFLNEIDFMGLTLIIVYVGAIAILFLFIIMMLDIKFSPQIRSFLGFYPGGFVLGFALFWIFSLESGVDPSSIDNIFGGETELVVNWIKKTDCFLNIQGVGQLLYSFYAHYLLIAGLILLIALVGAIVYTVIYVHSNQSQLVYKQISRSFDVTQFRRDLDKSNI